MRGFLKHFFVFLALTLIFSASLTAVRVGIAFLIKHPILTDYISTEYSINLVLSLIVAMLVTMVVIEHGNDI